ncbi:hypothetical protein [Arthrobacter sp. NIO-1057]|uniref:hypothetical protein n=1 Tax=Arthrobacter sp. NIO-1057 TaxID=993071 RepID=UPI00081827D3|nr:hypothetical protein [Arthrobacter sp. NIO-1057]SCC51159.1 hypothetical protein GA0061084_3193 [Arthrobacter sp. NIO-1057]
MNLEEWQLIANHRQNIIELKDKRIAELEEQLDREQVKNKRPRVSRYQELMMKALSE